MGWLSQNPLLGGLAIGAGVSLLTTGITSLFSSSNSGQSSATQTGICTTQYYYTATPPAGDPCAIYSPTGGTSNVSTLSNNSNPNDNSISDLLNSLTKNQSSSTLPAACSIASSIPAVCGSGYVSQSPGLDASGCPLPQQCVPNLAQQTSNNISSSLQSGATCGTGACGQGTYCSSITPGMCIPSGNVDCGTYSCLPGDQCAANGQCANPAASGSGSSSPIDLSGASSSTPALPASTPPAADLGSANTPADVPAGSTPVPVSDIISNPNLYVNDTSGSTPPPSQTPLNQNPIPVPRNGLHGDLLSFGGGVTIYAQSRTGNTEVSGFFGGGSAASLCRARPWASNFLSYVIPPAFFDNLCTWGGYPARTLAPGNGAGAGGGVNTVAGPGAPTAGTPAQRSSTAPQALIKASPPTVNLGGRTTVFWTSANVASCEESSSDGNFHGTSVSGGASTVSLSGPVTFSIACIGLDGTTARNSTTVNIGI